MTKAKMDLLLEKDSLSRRERERIFKQKEILSGAVRLFAKKGYVHTTLDEIAEISEFGKGTIYNYFQNKEEIYLTIIGDIFDKYYSLLRETSGFSDSFKEFITALTKKLFVHSLQYREEFMLLVRCRTDLTENDILKNSGIISRYNEGSLKIFEKKITAALKEKEIRKIDTESFMLLFRSMVYPYILFLMLSRPDNAIDIEKESKFILSVIFHGILLK